MIIEWEFVNINLMTFFGQEKKNLLQILKPTQKVGPGAYSP